VPSWPFWFQAIRFSPLLHFFFSSMTRRAPDLDLKQPVITPVLLFGMAATPTPVIARISATMETTRAGEGRVSDSM
jgi:hypothetical protein